MEFRIAVDPIVVRIELSPAVAALLDALIAPRPVLPPVVRVAVQDAPDSVLEPAVAAPKAAPPAPPAASAPPKPQKLPDDLPLWTKARCDVIRGEWPKGTDVHTVHRMLEALPGRPVPVARIAIQAAALGVRRPLPAPAPARDPTPPKPAPSSADSAFVEANYATVFAWAGQRGLATTREGFELDRVNAKRIELGLAPFRIVKAQPGSAAA
jgi:hypothetical protein